MAKRKMWDEIPFETQEDEDLKYWPWWLGDKYTKTSSDFVNGIVWARALATPDMRQLWKKDTQLVAVYGTLKQGFSNHEEYMRKGTKLCAVLSEQPEFTMMETLGEKRFPVLFNEQVGAYPRFRFFAELYIVPTSTLVELDTLESNGYLYNRKKVGFNVLGKEGLRTQAWCYIAGKEKWQRSLDNRALARSVAFQKNKEPICDYYFFPKSTKLRTG